MEGDKDKAGKKRRWWKRKEKGEQREEKGEFQTTERERERKMGGKSVL